MTKKVARASGLVVQFNVAIVEPPVRFRASAIQFLLSSFYKYILTFYPNAGSFRQHKDGCWQTVLPCKVCTGLIKIPACVYILVAIVTCLAEWIRSPSFGDWGMLRGLVTHKAYSLLPNLLQQRYSTEWAGVLSRPPFPGSGQSLQSFYLGHRTESICLWLICKANRYDYGESCFALSFPCPSADVLIGWAENLIFENVPPDIGRISREYILSRWN